MKLYQKKIRAYQSFIKEQYITDRAVYNTVERCGAVISRQGKPGAAYFEFLYEQSGFIQKRWWGLQGVVLLLLWLLLRDVQSTEYTVRIMGILATVFAILIIPEVWKNRRNRATEIERASFYSLRQICAARILLFAMADLMMIMVFFVIAYGTVQLSFYHMLFNFLLPFNVSACICFQMLCSNYPESEYIAIFASMMWMILWSVVVTHHGIYDRIAVPVWAVLLLLSFGYLIFLAQKSQLRCEEVWEENTNGIKA